ncbi:hypothetical protein, partial [Limnospira sp.]|uniref:hypothetical protein n=1 Tax=Limnospira sp. TaxID=3100384 RepID=UPI003F7167D0
TCQLPPVNSRTYPTSHLSTSQLSDFPPTPTSDLSTLQLEDLSTSPLSDFPQLPPPTCQLEDLSTPTRQL